MCLPGASSYFMRQRGREEGGTFRRSNWAVWHETIQGSNDEDVTLTLIKLLKEPQYRDAKEIVQSSTGNHERVRCSSRG